MSFILPRCRKSHGTSYYTTITIWNTGFLWEIWNYSLYSNCIHMQQYICKHQVYCYIGWPEFNHVLPNQVYPTILISLINQVYPTILISLINQVYPTILISLINQVYPTILISLKRLVYPTSWEELYTFVKNITTKWTWNAFVRQPVEKENSEFKPAVLHLNSDLVSHPTHGLEVDWIHKWK